MADIAFPGVGKSDAEGRAASTAAAPDLRAGGALAAPTPAGRRSVSTSSRKELESTARLGGGDRAHGRGCRRVNPNVDPYTHEYTTTGGAKRTSSHDADRIVGVGCSMPGALTLRSISGLPAHRLAGA
jgi:hypothetical protein